LVVSCGDNSSISSEYKDIKSYSGKIQKYNFIHKDDKFDISQITGEAIYDATIVY